MTDPVKFCLRRLCGDEDNETDLVFGGLHEPKRAFATAKKRAGVKNLTWHDLRHAFVSRAFLAGIPPRTSGSAT
jgi:integrase